VLAGGALALLALVGGGFFFVKGRGAKAPMVADASSDARRVAVLYFQSAADDSLRLLADGLTEGLIRELAPVQALNVVSRNGVAQFRGQNVPRDSIGKILGVGTLVEGNVERDGSQLRVTVRLIDAASGAEFQRTSFEQPAGSYLTLADSLSQKAALLLRERLGVEVRLREQRQRTSNPQAWVLVQRASALRTQVDSLARQDPEAASRALDQADSLLGAAIALDAKWPEPLIMRGGIASQRVRLANRDPVPSAPFLQQGTSAVEQALKLDPQDADALFQRGELRYWRYIIGLESDPAAAKQLLASAQSDFEASVKLNPQQAQAWASLSHLYNQNGSFTDVNLAARRAYEADAYLANIDVVIDRLFLSSYDLGQFPDAKHWCEEGTRRFPANYRFAMCRLQLLTTRAETPDVARAWRLRDSVVALTPENQRALRTLSAQMSVASVLARAQLPDSARHVIERSRGNPEIDASKDLLFEEAVAQAALGDKDAAFKALKAYWAANPNRQQGMVENPGWEFQALTADPRWQRLSP
jgi:serine/threonine-protein kinase